MTGMLKKTVLGGVLAATTLTAAVPAEAQWRGGYRGHRGGGGDAAAGAIIGGIVGLGLGAAIASNNNRGGYYDRGYYRDGYYAQPRGYYAEPRGYYYDDYNYRPRCYIERQYDRWNGRAYNVRVCN